MKSHRIEYGLQHEGVVQMVAKGFKACNACGKEIKEKAVFCVHCKSLLNKAVPGPASAVQQGKGPASVTSYTRKTATGIYKAEKMELKKEDLYTMLNEASRRMQAGSIEQDDLPAPAGKSKFEAVIRDIVEEYSEKVFSDVSRSSTERDYQVEEKRIIATVGSEAWAKLNSSSKTMLVSARTVYNNLLYLEGIQDYSGACLLAVKALETELFKRFFIDFIDFLEEKYPGKTNMVKWPTALLNKYDKHKPTKKYTLIGVTYVLCGSQSNSNTAAQNENNLEKLYEYAAERLFEANCDRMKISKLLSAFASEVEAFCNDYRNPSATRGELLVVDAEDCSSLIGDVERFLKKMLDSFTG